MKNCLGNEVSNYLHAYGQTIYTTTTQQHGGYQVEGHEAGDDCAARVVETGIPIQTEP